MERVVGRKGRSEIIRENKHVTTGGAFVDKWST